MEKYDITTKIQIPVGMYTLNKNPDISFQLNRLVNMDGCDLDVAQRIGPTIRSTAEFYDVLSREADAQRSAGHIKNAAALYRMAEFFTEWDDARGLAAWQTARELFFAYYEDFFKGEHPAVELLRVPYEGYTLPTLRFNAEHPRATVVMHGGFDSSFEEFFAECEYLREQGCTVYLFEGPGQGECIRLHGAPLELEWEKPVMALTNYFDLHDVTLVGQSLGGYFAPRASAFDPRVTKCVGIAPFPALKLNFSDSRVLCVLATAFVNVVLRGFGWVIGPLYKAKKGKGMPFFKTYFHRFGTQSPYRLANYLWQIDLRPIADKLTKDYLILSGSRDTMNCRASLGRQMLLLRHARSITAREITAQEQGADHCNCGNQKAAMDTILLWIEMMRRRDEEGAAKT